MIHQMQLKKIPFEKIKNGTKTIEIRCNDEKRQKIKVNDIIIFSLSGGNNTMFMLETTAATTGTIKYICI